MQNETQNLIEQVLASVSQHGAEGDVLITEEAQLGLKCHQGELSEYKVTSSRRGDLIFTQFPLMTFETKLGFLSDQDITFSTVLRYRGENLLD